MNVKELDIASIIPTQKDIDRADVMGFDGGSFFGNNSPYLKHALIQSKNIKDPIKMVRRAKAVVNRWGNRTWIGLSDNGRREHPANMWKPFEEALYRMGFSSTQVYEIERWRAS